MKTVLYWLLMPALLLAIWLLLNETFSIGHIVLGSVLALLLAWAAMALRPLRSTPKKPFTLIRLLANVVVDITKSNVAVARLIWLGAESHTPGFIRIPIELRDPHGLAALACIITYTPGTVWAGFSEQKGMLTLHVLDLKDENHWIRLIKLRYEQPLKEIFE